MRLILGILFVVSFVALSYAQSQDTELNDDKLVPYTGDSNVEFTEYGRIDYDLLIAKIMPDIFVEKLQEQGANVTAKDIVLERGFQNLIYEPHSYNCGYAIDHEKKKAYWLEAAINSTQIQYANIYEEIPRDPKLVVEFYYDCFSLLEPQVAEIFLEEKIFFTSEEEARAVAAVKHDLRGNENLNSHKVKIGKFNYSFNDSDVLSICGEFVGRIAGSKYFLAILHESGQLSLTLEEKLSSLCAIDKDSTLYDIKFKENPQRDKSLQPWENNRLETVFLKPSSAGKLLERNYLQEESIPSFNLEYASHLTPEDIEYRPENSSTVLKFAPFEQTSYMKFRIPDSGENYYFSYGDEDWHEGKLLWISVFVDGNEVKYNTSHYVRSPEAPHPSYYTDLVFKVPANSTDIKIHLEIENYSYTKGTSDAWE